MAKHTVDGLHPSLEAALPQMIRCQDAYDGQDAVYARAAQARTDGRKWTAFFSWLGGSTNNVEKQAWPGTAYLPSLRDQSETEYINEYRNRATWFGAPRRTVQGYMGILFRQEPNIKVPDRFAHLVDDVTLSGMSLENYVKWTARQVLITGRVASTALFSAEENRPYLAGTRCVNLTNWRRSRVHGKNMPIEIRHREIVHVDDPEDMFKTIPVEQFRVHWIDNGKWAVTVWRQEDWLKGDGDWLPYSEAEDSSTDIAGATLYPNPLNQSVDYIPTSVYGPDELGLEVQESPILSLVDTNFSLYRIDADWKQLLHFYGVPTPWAKGFEFGKTQKDHVDPSTKEDAVPLGAGSVWLSDQPWADAGVLEVSGEGAPPLERAMEIHVNRLAVLGSRVLEEQKAGVESAASQQFRHGGETSYLGHIANVLSEGLSTDIKRLVRFSGGTDAEVEESGVEIASDYQEHRMDSAFLLALVKAWQAGAGVDDEVLAYNLHRADLYPDEDTPETVLERIKQGKLAAAPPPMFGEDDEEVGVGDSDENGTVGNE